MESLLALTLSKSLNPMCFSFPFFKSSTCLTGLTQKFHKTKGANSLTKSLVLVDTEEMCITVSEPSPAEVLTIPPNMLLLDFKPVFT